MDNETSEYGEAAMIYNIHYDVCAVFVSLFTLFCVAYKKGLRQNTNRIFLAIIIAALISSIADIFGSLGSSYPDRYSLGIRHLWDYIFLCVHNLMPFFFTCYIIVLLGINYRMSKRHYLLLCFPISLVILAFLLNPFLNTLFYYDADKLYTHGFLFWLLYLDAFFYMALAIGLMIRFRSALIQGRFLSLLFFTISSTVPIAVQMLMPSVLIELFFQSVGLLGMLFSIEDRNEIINSITGIFNRYAFMGDMETALFTGASAQILIVKIPNTSYYNTTFGVVCVNGILREIASWLNSLGKGFLCYDCENGHFAIVIYASANINVQDLGAQIQKRFEQEWIFEDFCIIFPVQICIGAVPYDIRTMEQLLLIADAPFNSKNGKSSVILADEFDTFKREIIVQQAVDRAISEHTLQVWFQPIWDRRLNRIHSAEALIRLHDPKLGFISPEEFIPIAEKNGSVLEIGAFVFEEVCKMYTDNHLDALGIEYIDVNLSVVQCMNQKLVDTFARLMQQYSITTSRINLEITESAAASNQTMVNQTIGELRDLGFEFSLDDYGTGYSNFSYMFDMPFSIIKLDKSILWSAMENENAMVLLEGTMRMMQKMHYRIVVEGVETAEQKALLEELECDYFQGYYFSKALPEDQFIDYVQTFNHRETAFS